MKKRTLRYSLPVVVVASTFTVASLSNLMTADAQTPNLPAISAAELLIKVQQAQVPPFSGTVKLTANLGLPNLSGLGGSGSSIPSSGLELLMGTHTAEIAADGPTKVKVTMTGDATESSWIRNGNEAWAWNSSNQSVKHTKSALNSIDQSDDPDNQMNPSTAAANVLALVDPTTAVSVRTTAYVAGRAAYELVLTPKSPNSTVGEVVLSVDAATGTPLETRITAKGAAKPALVIGFTSVRFVTPDASTFSFVPPTGVKVVEVSSLAELLPISASPYDGPSPEATPTGGSEDNKIAASGVDGQGGSKTVGTAWETVVILTNGSSVEQLATLMGSASQVTLADGTTARLLTTRLINVLVATDGRVAVGAVNLAGLEAALAQPSAAS